MRPAPYLLRLDDHGLHACHLNDTGCTTAARFATGDASGFADWLAQQPGTARYRLVFDLVDEHVEVESVPRVRGADRRALLGRRFAMHFGDSPATWMHALGRNADAPHQEGLVLHGLTRATALTPWLDAIRRSGARLDAVTSATLLLGHFAPRTLRLDGSLLLVSLTRCGMRLSHVDRGVVRFTRLVPGIDAIADGALHEIDRTRAYLCAQPHTRSGELRTVVLAPSATRDLPQHMSTTGEGGIQHIPAISLLPPGMRPAGNDIGAIEAAHLCWLGGMPRALRCRTRSQRTGTDERGLPRPVPYTTAAAVAGALALAAFRWTDAGALEREAAAIEARTASLRSELSRLESARAPLPAAADELLAVMGQLEREQIRPLPAAVVFARVGAALDATPGIELDHLSWKPAPDAADATTVTLGVRTIDAADRPTGLAGDDALVAALADALERQGGRAFQHASAGQAGSATRTAAGPGGSRTDLHFHFRTEGPQ